MTQTYDIARRLHRGEAVYEEAAGLTDLESPQERRTTMDGRKHNISVYERERDEIEKHRGTYVTVRSGRVLGYSATFDEALKLAGDDPDALVLEAGSEPLRGTVRFSSSSWRRA